jgi:hypothetical protein
MPLADVCVHLATPLSTVDDPGEEDKNWIEGEPDETDALPGAAFDCFYYESGATEQPNPVGTRKVKGPTILFEAERDDLSLIHLYAEDEIVIDAPEILGVGVVSLPGEIDIPGWRFQVEGDPTPLAPPGDIIGWECRIKKVAGSA